MSTSDYQNVPQPQPIHIIHNMSNIRAIISDNFDCDRSKLFDFLQDCESKLKGSARGQTRFKRYYDFEDIKECFGVRFELFGDQRDLFPILEELNTSRQGKRKSDEDESIGRIAMIKEVAVQRLIVHSNEDISSCLRRSKPKNINKALTEALLEEKYLLTRKSSTQIMVNLESTVPFNRRTVNHNSPQSSGSNNNSRVSRYPDNFDSTIRRSNTNSNNNYHSPKFCNYCKRQGHSINECRRWKFNNRTRNLSDQPHSSSDTNRLNSERDTNNSLNENQSTVSVALLDFSKETHFNNADRPSNVLISTISSCTIGTSHSVCFIKLSHQDKDGNLFYFDLLIDTGSNVSLIKIPKLRHTDLTYNPQESSVLLGPNFYNHFLNAKFHVIGNNTSIRVDGLIANNFLKSVEVELNYNKLELKFKSIPSVPRSETVIRVNIVNGNCIKEGYGCNISILNGIFLAKAVLTVQEDNTAITTIINTLEKAVQVNFINLELTPFNETESHVFNVNSANLEPKGMDRISLLESNFRLNHLNDEERKSVLNLCHEFNHIFHLPNDDLTFTEAV
ncbi:hypothetical protein ABEB36_015020 [Hypothenemus hampei]|uniref:Peptidase A2 domain-containing protein n=1 Tax=Hypothenemus hampei TaxID=57062 RepID=A0ABD1E1L6_HYPHA